MSGTNQNCHVSTKWEDTGGNNSEYDGILLNPNSNDISLQELIENELALRTGESKNGVDSQKMLICDMDEAEECELLSLNEKLTSENVNSCSNLIKSKNRTVTEVDDFDLLYNDEVKNSAANEIMANGHADSIKSFETTDYMTSSSNSFEAMTMTMTTDEQKCDTPNQNQCDTNVDDCESPDANANSVASDSLQNQITIETALSSLCTIVDGGDDNNRVLCDDLTNNVDISRATSNVSNNSNLDFVPVSEVNIVEFEDVRVLENVDAGHERFPGCESVLQPASAKEDDWVCVRDATTVDEENDAKVSTVNDAVVLDHAVLDRDPDTLERECVNQNNNVTVISSNNVSGDSCEATGNAEGSSYIVEDEYEILATTECTNNSLSCENVNVTLTSSDSVSKSNELATEIESLAQQTSYESMPQCNGWPDVEQPNEADVLVLNTKEDNDCFGYVDKTQDHESKDVTQSVPRSSDDNFNTPSEVLTSVQKYVINKSETKLIEECCYNLTQCSSIEAVSESNVAEKKSVKKKKSTSEESVTTSKTKKTKKTKKYEEKENISVKSGFGKFDQLTRKAMVRSSDSAKAQQQFSQNDANQDSGSICKACNKNVFAMEQIKAERHVWHKNCFRCKTCNKQLTVDVYSSHEGELFCKPHFRDLFKPKIVVEEEKPASDKPDLGLEELSSLNVKSRFQVFEKPVVEDNADKSPVCVKRSPSILSKLAKFQAKGMDVGVPSDIFNGIDYEESSSSDEEPAQNENVTKNSVAKEKPIAFNKMNDVKMNWENGQAAKREERQEERRQERQNIRSRLFMGKQNKMREAYENAVAESERGNVKKDIEIKSEKARSIKEKFEKGEIIHNDESDEERERKNNAKNEDMDVFEAGISRKSRSLFEQMDAAIKTQSNNSSFSSPNHVIQNGHRSHKEVITRQVSNDVVRASDPVEEVTVETADISSKFKFFETYKAPEVKRKTFRFTPPREGQLKSELPEKEIPKNPDVIRCQDQVDNEDEVLKKSNTTAKMLSLFRQLEEAQEVVPDGPKPMKKFTPPPASSSGSEAESEDDSEEASEASIVLDDVVRSCDKTEDEYLKMAQNAAKAKTLKEKFEKWEPEKQSNNNAVNLLESEQTSLDTTKSLRARFESLKAEQPTDKPRPKVNRFVDKSLPGYCDTCFKKVYPLEKVEAGDKVFHRSCFKCTRCSGILRMETFTMNNGHLYCVPHFKQLFITKGNYDEGFGNDQHKAKWPVHTGLAMTNGLH